MKAKILQLCLVFVTGTSVLFAQSHDPDANYLLIGFAPLNLIEPRTSTWENSLEVQFNNYFSLEARVGLKFTALHKLVYDENQQIQNNRYFDYKLGIRHLIAKKRDFRKRANIFLGLEYFHLRQDYEVIDDYYFLNEHRYRFDFAKFRRRVNGLRAKFGLLLFGGDRWVFEFFTGTGIKEVSNEYYDIVNERVYNPNFFEYLFRIEPSARYQSDRFHPDFFIGFKISYKILRWN